MDGRRIVQQALDAQRVRDSHWMGPGLSVQQAMAASNAVSGEGMFPGSAQGWEIVRQAFGGIPFSRTADFQWKSRMCGQDAGAVRQVLAEGSWWCVPARSRDLEVVDGFIFWEGSEARGHDLRCDRQFDADSCNGTAIVAVYLWFSDGNVSGIAADQVPFCG